MPRQEPTPDYESYIAAIPDHFRQENGATVIEQDNEPIDNPISNAGAMLGRVLFYDQRLSANNMVSCASCHQQAHAFSDTNRFSIGFTGELTERHSMSLLNARYYQRGHFFWDERADTLEDQVLQPIQNEVEMGLSLREVEEKVAATEFYPPLFAEAFGDATVTSDRISQALAQFVRAMVSYQAKYDRVQAGSETFTPQEALGRNCLAMALEMTRQMSDKSCHASFACP